MDELHLDLFVEDEETRSFGQRMESDLKEVVARLAPHIDLNVDVLLANDIKPWVFEWEGRTIQAVYHEPSSVGRQSVLITRNSISGAQGWGSPTYGVVSLSRMEQKAASGGAAVDIILHEWIHTLQDKVINGRAVPFADDAEKCGFVGVPGPDQQLRWDAWYAFALGGQAAKQLR